MTRALEEDMVVEGKKGRRSDRRAKALFMSNPFYIEIKRNNTLICHYSIRFG